MVAKRRENGQKAALNAVKKLFPFDKHCSWTLRDLQKALLEGLTVAISSQMPGDFNANSYRIGMAMTETANRVRREIMDEQGRPQS